MNISSLLELLPLLQNGNIADLFSGGTKPIDFLLKGLGVSSENCEIIMTAISRLLSGDIDIKVLIPLLLPIVLEFFGKAEQKENASQSSSEAFDSFVRLSPVENIADEKIYVSLENYFKSDSAC